MANTFFKSFAESDRTSSRTLLHEAIPITGTIVSGAYVNTARTLQDNIKSFSHGMFKSVYDYPYLSSSANQIFDVSYGVSANSWTQIAPSASATLTVTQGNLIHGMTAGQKITITSTDGTVVDYFISDTGNGDAGVGHVAHLGAVAHGATLDSGVTASRTAGSTKGIAVGFNLGAALAGGTDQAEFLGLLSGAINHANGHAGKIIVGPAPTAAGSAQTMTLTQKTGGKAGNATITENIANLAAAGFHSGMDKINQRDKKTNMYTQMAQILAGFNVDGTVRRFDADGDYSTTTDKHNEAFFVSFSRLLVKDEIKKGSFSMKLGKAAAWATAHSQTTTITDAGAETSYKLNSPAGEFGILTHGTTKVGLLYYQAGIAVLTSSVLGSEATTQLNSGQSKMPAVVTGSTMDALADAFAHRVKNISFNNTTELNSTIYFCRANHNEFNYSSNPTYLSGSKLVVKSNNIMNPPRSYATTVGLYSADNELLAVAKLSEPLRKDPTNELTLRVRLDY
tara:strand:+ start:678 stop:2204 length:1527 start_codon:yes stop_codon:yes gene_type:complete